jgi:hypothetical protein
MKLTAVYVAFDYCEMHDSLHLVLKQQSAVRRVQAVAVKCTNNANITPDL